MGLRTGWPDFLIIYRRIHGLELKREGGELSRSRWVRSRRNPERKRWVEGQREVFPRLIAAGMTIATVQTIEQVRDTLRGWGIPMREVRL